MWIETAGGYLLNLAQCLSIHVAQTNRDKEQPWAVIAYDGKDSESRPSRPTPHDGGYHELKRFPTKDDADAYRSAVKQTLIVKLALITV